nr:MFS transporter [Actinomycetales bacterium]
MLAGAGSITRAMAHAHADYADRGTIVDGSPTPSGEHVPTSSVTAPERALQGWRGRETILLYAAYMLGAWGINGMGSILLPLQGEYGVARSGVAFYPTLYSSGLILVGLFGARLVRRIGLQRTLVLALALTVIGALLMAVPSRLMIGIGALVFGVGGAFVTLVMPVRFGILHGRRSARAVTEANAAGSVAAIVAPLAVAAALTLHLGWRVGYVLPIVAAAAALLVTLRRELAEAPGVASTSPDDDAPSVPLRALLGRWSDIPLAVSAEFSLVFWAAAAMVEWHGAPEASATVAAASFLVGMALGRIFGGPLMDRFEPRILVLGGTLTALAGFAVFWSV